MGNDQPLAEKDRGIEPSSTDRSVNCNYSQKAEAQPPRSSNAIEPDGR